MAPVAQDGLAPHRFIDSLAEACLVVDEQLMVAEANYAASRLYARPHDYLSGYYMGDLCAEGHDRALISAIDLCSSTPVRLTVSQLRGDGSVFSADVSVKACTGCRHFCRGHSVLVVREHPPAPGCDELELRSTLLEECIDAMVAHTLDGELLYANRAALEQWGYDSFDQIKARGPYGWSPPEQRGKIAERTASLATIGELRFTSFGTRGNGVRTYNEVHARMVKTTCGPVVFSVSRDVSHRRHAEEMVRYLAYHDTLTGLANRTAFAEELDAALASAARNGGLTGLVYIDVNDFKPINDSMGHSTGDRVLQTIAKRINGCVRLADTVARMGGDEFIVLLPRLRHKDDLQALARKIVEEVSRPMHVSDLEVSVSVSVGLATHAYGESPEAFVNRADLAMYESRQTSVPGWELAWH